MSEPVTVGRNERRGWRLVVVATVSAAVLALASTTAEAAASLLPRNTIVPLSVVTQYFPEVTQEAGTGPNETVVGKPTGTISVVFTTGDPAQKVTLSLDRYASAHEALAAYKKAVKGSEAAPGYTPAPDPHLGQRSFAGSSQVGDEKHFGLGALAGKVIVSATYAGLPVTTENSNSLITLAGLVLASAENQPKGGVDAGGGGTAPDRRAASGPTPDEGSSPALPLIAGVIGLALAGLGIGALRRARRTER